MKSLFVVKILFFGLILVYSLDPSTVVLALNCGTSTPYTSTFGFVYAADNYFTTGSSYACSCSIGLTQNQTPYKVERFSTTSPSWGYRIPISTDGTYVIILQFAEIYFTTTNSRVFTIKIGNYVVKSNLDLVAQVGAKNACDLFVQFTLTSGVVYINGSSITGAFSSGKLVLDFYRITENPKISGIILVKGDCTVADNCNMCYDLKCLTCNSSTVTCTTCIANATPVSGVCKCNANAFYVTASNTCVICDDLCGACISSTPFLCTTCPSPYFLVSSICLRACPYGFTSPCVSVSSVVIDTNFATYFYGTYGLFKTGTSGSSYYFFNSPESSADPVPVKSRGLYFSGGTYLETISAVYFSLNFSLGMWVWIIPGSGNILTHSSGYRIIITETGVLKIILENQLEATMLVTTSSLSPANSAWVYLSYVISFTSPSTTIKPYLNNVAQTSATQSGYIYRDPVSNTIILGKSSVSNFNGYIYQFQLWNSAVSNFNTQYSDQICGTGAIANCLWSCGFLYWISSGTITACDGSCPNGCTRNGSCNVCYDPLCSVCRGFIDGLCDQCVTNASGTPCTCNPGYMLSPSGFSCIACSTGCSACTGISYYQCSSCFSGYFLLKTQCLTFCPSGYTSNSSSNTCSLSNSNVLSLNFQNLIQLDTVNGVTVGGSITNTYPTWESGNKDPIPSIYRGYYFTATRYMTTSSITLGPWFSLLFWVRATNNGVIFSKYDGATWWLKIALASSKPQFTTLTLSDSSTTLSILGSSSIANTWAYLGFTCGLNGSGQTVITLVTGSTTSATSVTGPTSTSTSSLFYNDAGALYLGSISGGFTGWIWNFNIYNDNTYALAGWRTSGCSAGCSSCPLDSSVCPDNCNWNYFNNAGTCFNCGTLSCNRGCRNTESCNLCLYKECLVCTLFDGPCTSCITNAYFPSPGVCACKLNAFWDTSSLACTICDTLCDQCQTTLLFLCSTCSSAYVPVSNVCLRSCPYGFAAGCTPVSTPVIDTSFNGLFLGTYGIFTTGTSASKYQFFYNPEAVDPIPVKDRGLYFDGQSYYLQSNVNVYLSHSFSLGAWIYVVDDGDFVQKLTRVFFSSKGDVKIILEGPTTSTTTKSIPGSATSFTSWTYLSLSSSLDLTAIVTTITVSVNNAVFSTPTTYQKLIYRDTLNTKLTIGKSTQSYFQGYIFDFKLWNAAVDFTTTIDNAFSLTPGMLCNLTQYYDGAACANCDISCTIGCTRAGSCNQCDDKLCAICTGFAAGLCTQCVSNAGNTPCACNPGYTVDSSGFSCIKLALTCATGTGSQYNQCLTCNSPFYLLNTICTNACPDGYDDSSGINCISTSNPSLSISLNDIIQLNTVSNVGTLAVGLDNTNLYPLWENSDPSPAINRGYYFSTKNSLQGGTFLISPWFTVSIWIRPVAASAQYVFLKKDGTLEILAFKIASSTAISLKMSLSDRTLLTLTQTSGSSLSSKWNLMSFTGQIISSGAYQINSYINNAASSAVTGSDPTVYFFDSGKLYIGSDASSLNGLKGFIYTLKIYTDQNKNTADWSSSCSGCTNCPVGGVCPNTCQIAQYPDGSGGCPNCDPALSCSRGCRSWDTCRLCADKTCYSCTSFSGPCTGCIPNASQSGSICACNANAIWVHVTESCDICDNLCSHCASTIYFECSLCAGSNVLVGTICLRSCPTGFSTSPCTTSSTPLLNEHFDTSFEGSYDILVTSADATTYQFFHSPDSADPIPAKSRGLYFSGAQYLVSSTPMYLSHDFSVGLWVYPISGDIFQKDPIISMNSNGTASFLLETELEVDSLETSTVANLPDWVYLSASATYSSASTTLKFYMNNGVSWTASIINYIARDQLGKYLYIGKSQNTFFEGFIYTFKLWNYAVSSFSTEYSADICGGSGISCLWDADITYYVSSGTNKPCLTSCSYGCVRGTSCNICDDPLCNKCSSFYAGDCYQCVTHASGVPCTCESTYYLSSSGSTCLDCFLGCSVCTSSDYNTCSQCISGYYLFNNVLCDTQCPDGFIQSTNICQLDKSLIIDLSLNDYIVLDTLSGFNVGADNSGKYPDFDANDPVPAINRGYFFNGNSLMKMASQSIFSPYFTIIAWTYPQKQGAILLKSNTSTDFLKLTIDSSGFLTLVITLNDASTLISIASTNTMGSWHYCAFTAFIETSGATTVSIYIDSSLLTTMTSTSKTYFRDASSSLNLGMISSSSTASFQGFLWSLKIFNDETHKDNDWPASSCTSSPCISCPTGSFCPSYCPIWQYPDTTTCTTCKTSCGTYGCRTDQTCRLCLQKECYSCTSFSGNCLKCITNADFVGTQCQCNKNALWVEATETCDLCNSVCESCTDFTFTGCVKCESPLLMISNVCVSFCPLGYSSSTNSCTLSNDFVFSFKPLQIKDQVIDSKSSISLYAGADTSFYPYYKTSDPYAAEYRGYYFRGSSYMKSKDTTPYLTISPIFTFVAWIRPHSDSGCIFSKQDSTSSVVNIINFSLASGGFPSLTIKLQNGAYVSYTSSSLSVTLSTWNFLMAISIISGTPEQQILFYVDTSLDNSPDLGASWFQDIQSSFFLSIGAALSSLSSSTNFYTGFLWSFAVYNSQKSAADLILFSSCSGCSVCPIELANVCLPDCELSNYWDTTSCQACQVQCNWGCVRYDKNCNLCQDVICSVCDDYTSVCITCMTNAHLSGSTCVCDDNYFWDSTNEICSQCDVSCNKCTAAGNSNCVSCASDYFTSAGKCIDTCSGGLFLYAGQCLASCPAGYVGSNYKCVLGKTFIFDLSFSSLKGILTDSQSQIQALTGNSQDFYPTYDSEDPIAAPLRGFYFNGSTSIMHLPSFQNLTSAILNFTSSFTISIWINPEQDDGVLIIKQDTSLNTVFSIMLKAGYAQLELLFLSNGKTAFTSLNIPKISEWNHIAFTADYQSANTIVSSYINGILDSASAAISDYFSDLKTGVIVTIGAQKASSKYINFFKGFIYEIQGYNIVKTISSLALPQSSCKEACQACPIDGVCIPNCLISQFWIGPAYNKCSACNSSCKSCKDSGSKCNLCYDEKCLVCESYSSGSCTTCKNGTSNPADCQCENNLVWNSTADSCQSCPSNQYASEYICHDCPKLCASCTGELACESCVENAMLASQLCVCKPGYTKNSTSCLYISFSVNLTVNYDNTLALNFSDGLMNKLTESQITIKISKGVVISWNITMMNDTYYLITCTFGASVSYGTQITISFNDLTQVLSTSNGMLKDSTLTGILNKSILTSSQQQTTITSNQVSATTQAVIGVSAAVSCLNPNSSGLWALLNTISYLYFIPISGFPISDNIYAFFNAMNNANLIPNFFAFFVDQSQGHTPYADAVKFGFSNDLILINAGNQLTVLCYIVGIFPIVFFLAKCSERYIGKKFDAILKQYKFSTFLRFWVQSYLDIGFPAIIGLLTALQNWNSLQSSTIEIVNTLMCLMFTVLLIISPISLAIFSYRNMHKVTEKRNKTFHDVWGSFFYEFKNDNGLLSTQYYTLFFLRRNVYFVSFIFFNGSPYTQLTIGVILCVAFTFYIIVYAPFDDPVMQWSNALSEIGITVVFFMLSGYLFNMSGESLGYLDNSLIYTVIGIMGIQTMAPFIISIITLVQVIKQKLEGKAGLRSRPLRSAKVNPKRVEINNLNDFFDDNQFISLNAGDQSPSTILGDDTNTISQKPIKYYYPSMT